MRDSRKIKYSNKPFENTLNELMVFKQMLYCKKYITIRYSGLNENEIDSKAKVASACFRQAFQFYDSARSAMLSTSPLLFSYCVNNLIRGFAFLYSTNTRVFENLQNHGFSVKREKLNKNLLDSTINIKNIGVVNGIQLILGDKNIKSQNISFEMLLSHIPEISNIFQITANKPSNVAKRFNNQENTYEIQLLEHNRDINNLKNVCDYIGIVGSFCGSNSKLYCGINLIGAEVISKENMEKNMFYNDYIILPQELEDGIYSLNILFYTYLLIMSYGMIVRYNADKWEDYIDPKISNEVQLISESVEQSIQIIFVEIHRLLYGYSYKESYYNDNEVEKVIDQSTERIMNNIKEKIKRDNLVYGTHKDLPW